MLRIQTIITVVLVVLGLSVNAQTDNPFELKYRNKNTPSKVAPPKAEPTKPIALSDVTIDSSSSTDSAEPNVINALDTVADLPREAESTEEEPSSPDTMTVQIINTEKNDLANDEEIEEASPPVRKPVPPVPSVGVALILVMMGITLLVLTWAVNMNRGFIRKIFRAAMNENLSALLLREQKFASLQYLYYIVYAVFFINSALFIYLMARYAIWDFGHRSSPLIAILGILIGIYLLRHLFMRILGQTFTISKETTHFSFNIVLYNILAGIALMPVNLFLAFGPPGMRMPVIYFGIGLLAILYLLRQLRGLNIAGHLISSNVFQFFVYLCAVEILPVLVLFKYFITN